MHPMTKINVIIAERDAEILALKAEITECRKQCAMWEHSYEEEAKGASYMEAEIAELKAQLSKRLTVRVEIPPTLLQDALRTFYELVCRYESHLASTEPTGSYVPWRNALRLALDHNGVEVDDPDAETQASD